MQIIDPLDADETAATLDSIEQTKDVFEARFVMPWSFTEEAAAEKHIVQLQHNMRVVAAMGILFVIAGGGNGLKSTARRSTPSALYRTKILALRSTVKEPWPFEIEATSIPSSTST
jgi:hypothetical protein